MLTTAALITSESLHIGITSDEMISKKDIKEILQPYCLRKNNVECFFKDIGFNKTLNIEALNESTGKSGSSKDLNALIITEETLKGGNFVNEVPFANIDERKKRPYPCQISVC
jgi:phosphopantetheine adenylyltransferase